MKKNNYKQSLHRLMTEYLSMPFAWGVHDCTTFAAKVVSAVSDRKIALIPEWDSEESAHAYMAERGGIRAAVDSVLGDSVPWGQCGTGDIVLAELWNGPVLAVHDGTQLIAPGPTRLRRIPFEYAVCGWIV